ncbi:glycine betaine ABC transporter substrate-binding protein [Aliagarivorans marinus]|uniref:glycine betaine ABC transporter substrate-binding protein n=1 Tax=Aliagarivorans marinus TaxID=561965 RepID=UPI000403AB46|nr:glycine betaine ABC transporter substrate-binding protein [Aliagarivorans marinus]
MEKWCIGLMLAVLAGTAQACEKVTIAEMGWSSASVVAHIDQYVLEHGFGCEVELVDGDTLPTAVSMLTQGFPDIAPEYWLGSMKTAINKAVMDQRLRYAGDTLSDGGEEGFWVPAYLVEKHPELATIDGVIKHAKLFRPDEDASPTFHNCPSGWNCQVSGANLFKALQLEQAGFELVEAASGTLLADSISSAYQEQRGWLGVYWAPTAVLGEYPMVKVDFGSGIDEKHFQDCISRSICNEAQPTMYPPTPVLTLTTGSFAEREPAAFTYLEQRSYSNPQMNQLLAWMERNQASSEQASRYFLETNPELWQAWLPAEVADALRASFN